MLTINYTDKKGAGISKTVPPNHDIIVHILSNLRTESTLKNDNEIIGRVWNIKGQSLDRRRKWNWYYEKDVIDRLNIENLVGRANYKCNTNQCKGNPTFCDCESCLKIKGEW